MGCASGLYTFVCLLFSILLPPLGVVMRTGQHGSRSGCAAVCADSLSLCRPVRVSCTHRDMFCSVVTTTVLSCRVGAMIRPLQQGCECAEGNRTQLRADQHGVTLTHCQCRAMPSQRQLMQSRDGMMCFFRWRSTFSSLSSDTFRSGSEQRYILCHAQHACLPCRCAPLIHSDLSVSLPPVAPPPSGHHPCSVDLRHRSLHGSLSR